MNSCERERIKSCLSQPAQKRFDVPVNGGVIIIPIEFLEITGDTTSSHTERMLASGSLQYRVIKQISKFGNIILFDYYESEIYDKQRIDKFGLPRDGFLQQMSHNIKIGHNGKIYHFLGVCHHVEIIDVKCYSEKYFFIQTKTCYGEMDWIRL